MPRPKKPVGTHVFQKDQKELSDCNAVRQLFLYVISSIIMLLGAVKSYAQIRLQTLAE